MHTVGKQATNKAWASALSVALFGVVGGGLMVGVAGCEKMESAGRAGDRKVDVAVNESIGTADPAKAAGIVKNSMSDASDAGKARAASELARDEFNEAMALVPKINYQAQLASAALFDLSQVASQINDMQRGVGRAAQQNPQDALGKLDEGRGEMQKALDKAKADAAALKADLDKRQKEIDDLKAQRQKADADAEALLQKSNGAKGEESVNLFKQSTDARTQSGTLAAQIETKTAAMMPVQRQLAMAQAQQQLWDNPAKDAPGAMQQLDDRKAQISAAWQDSQTQAQGLTALAKKVATEVIVPGGSADRPNAGSRLAAAMSEGDKARAEAKKLLQSAAGHTDDAFKAAKALHGTLNSRVGELSSKGGSSSELPSLQAMLRAFDESQYALQKGNIELALGNVCADEFVLASRAKQTMDAVSQALQAGGQSMPAGWTAPNPDAAKTEAEKAFAEAEKSLESVANMTGNFEGMQTLKNSAIASLMLARYGHYQLTLDDATRARLHEDIARAKDASITVPAVLRGI